MADESGGRSPPLGVKIISILGYIGGGIGVVMSLATFLFGGGMMSTYSMVTGAMMTGMFGLFWLMALIGIVLSVFEIVVAYYLWHGKNWARIVVIVFTSLGVVGALFSLIAGSIFSGIVSLAINGLIVWYLGFNEEAKSFFS